jgi:hypothetical protein
LPLSKRVTKVWLDDPSRITVDFDAPLKRGASVIHLKRIEPVNFPGIPKSSSTLLTVIAEGASGAGEGARNNGRERYQFRVTYGEKGQPSCYGYDVLPDPVALSTSNGPALEEESLLREGLAIAKRRGTLSPDAGNTVLETRVKRYIELRQRGVEGEAARQGAKVSRAFLDRLEELAISWRGVRGEPVSGESISEGSCWEGTTRESDGDEFWRCLIDGEFF